MTNNVNEFVHFPISVDRGLLSEITFSFPIDNVTHDHVPLGPISPTEHNDEQMRCLLGNARTLRRLHGFGDILDKMNHLNRNTEQYYLCWIDI